MLRTLSGLLIAVVVGACGPGLRAPDARVEARGALADAAGDAATLEGMMRDEVVVGKLWFEDARCAQFSSGAFHADQFAALARCLAGLKLRPSAREDALGDVTVMSYGPGFEVEARVVTTRGHAQLAWIGFASQHAGSPSLPTLDAATFEGLRASGERVPVLEAATVRAVEEGFDGKDEVALVWLKVCIDSSGVVTTVDAYEPTSYAASDAFTAAVRAWTFRPFLLAGHAVPACSMVRMAYPADKAPSVEVLPLPPPPSRAKRPPLSMSQRKFHDLVEGKRISGEKLIVPDDDTKWEIRRLRLHRIEGRYRVCVDDTGHVESVLPMFATGFPAYDRDILAAIQRWVYAPYMIDGQPVPVCTAVTFIYSQR